jgi:hypothetical protein
MESVLETKASTLLEFIAGLRGSLFVTFEEITMFTERPVEDSDLVRSTICWTMPKFSNGSPVVHQNLPRTEKAVNPCPLCPRTFDVLLSHSANRVDPNPTKKEGWGAKTTNQGACPEMKSR